jgi:F420-dependent oxidoreductase-like protein
VVLRFGAGNMVSGMRFGLFIPQGWRLDLVGVDATDQWQAMLGVARFAETGPWESVWVFDHFHTTPIPTGEATHEAWALMSALAASTQRVRLGQMCSCMGYRNPMYLAKVAATVDVISGGRVEMGIGAGWYEHEWNAYGYGFPAAGDRIAMLEEGVEIMRQAWLEGVARYAGEHYQVDGALCHPRPLQPGGIPFWIAGGGEKKTLRIAAQRAAYTNFDGTPEVFAHKSEVLAGHCKDIGRDFDEIVRSANYNVVIGRTGAEVQERLARIEDRYRPYLAPDGLTRAMESFRSGPLVGTHEQITQSLKALERIGLGYVLAYFAEAANDTSGIELFVDEVVPALA